MIAPGGAVLAALLLATDPAHAHDVVAGVGGFYGGLLHPLLVPAHVLALTSLGLLIGQQTPRQRAGLLGCSRPRSSPASWSSWRHLRSRRQGMPS
jgi:hydrogenase/urease accessory protein HupE